MKSYKSINRFLAGGVAMLPWILATAAFAQEGDGAAAPGGDADVSRNYFQMFFMTDDWIGNIIIWFLVLLSFICLGYGTYLLMKYRRNEMIPEATFDQVQTMLEAKQYREAIDFVETDDSYLGKLLSSALTEASNGYSAMERAVEESSDLEITRVLRPLELLNVVGNIAPMMGLFGTVYGMIVAFQKLVGAGGRPDPAELAGGISTALVTTFWGLVVAIPSLALYALIRNKIDAQAAEGTVMAEELIRPFKPSSKKRSSSGSSSSSSGGSPSRPQASPKPA